MHSPQRVLTFADSPYVVLDSDRLLLVDCSGGPVEVDLPSALSRPSKTFEIIKTDASANGVVLTPLGGALINGAATLTFTTRWQLVGVTSDGTDYIGLYGAISQSSGGGGSGDFEMSFSGTLSASQNNLIPAKTKKTDVTVDRLDVELQEASAGEDVTIEVFSGVTSLGVVTVAAGALSGTLAITPTVVTAGTRVTSQILTVGTTTIAITASIFARSA